jgi:hypothetical protein
MEAVICESPWSGLFDPEDLQAANWRMDEAKRRVRAGESHDSEEY